jgi:hypothetical protein
MILGYVRAGSLTVNPDVDDWYVDLSRGWGKLTCPICGAVRAINGRDLPRLHQRPRQAC